MSNRHIHNPSFQTADYHELPPGYDNKHVPRGALNRADHMGLTGPVAERAARNMLRRLYPNDTQNN